jgi:hypothetical protein
VDFADYAASFFNPYLFTGSVRSSLGCGISALALLSGTLPEVIAARRRSNHCSDDFMLRFLRAKGFQTLRLTQCNVSVAKSSIGAEHVLLLSQLFRRNEGTWVVLFNGSCYHNFDQYLLKELSFLNKPILSAYVVVHPRWKVAYGAGYEPLSKPKPLKRGLTMETLFKAGVRRHPASSDRYHRATATQSSKSDQ